jgi:translocator protein
LVLGVSLLAVAVVAGFGATWIDTEPGSWYDQLDKPSWNPPGAVFGIAWTILYVMMAVAAWLVATHGLDRADVRAALVVYGVQLVMNLGWTFIFFAIELPGWALAEIVALVLAVLGTIALFARVDRRAAWLLVPYVAWLTFATALNASILLAN